MVLVTMLTEMMASIQEWSHEFVLLPVASPAAILQ